MKKTAIVFLMIPFLLIGCAPSQKAIQKAIEQTQDAMPTTTPTPTPSQTPTLIPLSEINLESALIQSGDLPAGYSGGQIRDVPPKFFMSITDLGANSIQQEIVRNDKLNGFITILIYEDVSQAQEFYSILEEKEVIEPFRVEPFSSEYKTVDNFPNVGEKSAHATYDNYLSGDSLILQIEDTVFLRCNAVVMIHTGSILKYGIQPFAEKIDKRLTELVCR